MITWEQTIQIRGYLMIMILLFHVSGANGFHNVEIFLKILLPSSVAFFLYSTGYGLWKNYREKGDLYLTRFMKDKLLYKICIPYITVCILYAGVRIAFGDSNIFSVPRSQTFLPNAWYIDFTIITYIVFYATYRYIKNKHYRIMALTIACVLYLKGCLTFGYSSTWYGDLPALILGVFVAYYEEYLISFIEKHFSVLFIFTLIALTITNAMTFGYFKFPLSGTLGAFATSAFTAIIFVLVGRRITVSSKILDWIGKNSYLIYLLHGVVLSFQHYFPFFKNPIALSLGCFLITGVLVWCVQKLNLLISSLIPTKQT